MKNHSNGMIHHKDYVAGWLDSSISEFLEHLPDTFRSTTFALVTSLDSDFSPSELLRNSPELKSIANEAKPLGKGFVVPTSLILKNEAKIFYGFDEVWFFPHDQISPKPKSTWLVGPNRIDQTALGKLGSWMIDNECSLAMGDGDGLNFIVKARGLIKHLLAFTMSQPQPEIGGEKEEAYDEEESISEIGSK